MFNVVFYSQNNQYRLFKDGIEYVIHAHRMKKNFSLTSADEMKRLVNASKNFVLMMIKFKGENDHTSKTF